MVIEPKIKVYVTFEDEQFVNHMFPDTRDGRTYNASTDAKLELYFDTSVKWKYYGGEFILSAEDTDPVILTHSQWCDLMKETLFCYDTKKKAIVANPKMIDKFFKLCDEHRIKYTRGKQE